MRRNFFAAAGLLCLIFVGSAQAALPIQHWQTENGTRIYFVENHDLPMLDVSIEFDAGSSRDASSKSGLASLTRHMLVLGAAGLSDDEIARRLAEVGAALGGGFDQDRAGYTLRTLSSARERDQALGTLAKILQQPDFPEAVLEREKARMVAAVKEAATQPASIADKAFYAALYGSHPYAQLPTGGVETINAVQRRDLVEFYRSHYGATNAVIALIGDVSREQAEAIARNLSAGLPAGTGLSQLPPVEIEIKGENLRIPHPASQSHILLGYPGLSRDDPDYFPLYVGNYILGGGGFVSRLTHEVREKRGLAYSVYSYFFPLRQQGPFEIGLQTKKEQADEALQVVRATLAEFVAKGPTEQELRQAKQHVAAGFPLRIDSNKKILDYLALIGFYRLPLSWLDDYVNKVEQVSAVDIREAFARRIRLDNMVMVMVGAPNESRGSDAK